MISVAVDIGGTFTDVVVMNDGKVVTFAKVPSTPRRLADGIVHGVLTSLGQVDYRPDEAA